MSDVYARLTGQDQAVALLRKAVAGERHSMSHAWLFTGPPGSGRSVAALAFAAALQCEFGGCGECKSCQEIVGEEHVTHPDVMWVKTDTLSIGVERARELAMAAQQRPVMGRYRIIVISEADLLTDRAADALLKSLEEPASRCIWLLCAPTKSDVIVTVRSRCRFIELVLPAPAAIAQLLREREGVEPQLAAWAARVCGGHIGRAKVLATSEEARSRRTQVLAIPPRLDSLLAALEAAEALVGIAKSDSEAQSKQEGDKRERNMNRLLGLDDSKPLPRFAQAQFKHLEEQQKLRGKRLQRNSLDVALTELTNWFRDVLAIQTDAKAPLVNQELQGQLDEYAARSTANATIGKLDAILACRTALAQNVTPLLATQALMISLI
ncbi:MAG: DNA polymerase III subunit delta' [Propionibacteriaceae bacterium]|jgi:DNA polymerase-3 subunit delta'|nr:DNA polymerase III subunit delta' [Propionibacteriaceae bacterium]